MPNSGSPVNCGLDIAGTGFLTTYAYDLANHKTTITQGAQTRVFQTDSLGRTVLVQEPEAGATTYSYAYNGTGLVVTRQRPRANQTNTNLLTTTTTQYDAVGRPVSVNYDDAITPGKKFVYDISSNWGVGQSNLKGHVSQALLNVAVKWAGDIFSYEAMGRVAFTGQCFPYGCGNGTMDKYIFQTYDWASNLTSETDPSSGTINYGRSNAGEVTSITNTSYNDLYNPGNLVSNVQNGPFGPISYQLGNGLGVGQSYDALGRLNGRSVCSGATNVGCIGGNAYLYGFQIAMQGQRITEQCDGFCASLGYDEFNRLTSFTPQVNGQQSFTYTYDRYGNRWAQNAPQGGPSSSIAFDAASNRVAIAGYAYDSAGNLANDGSHSYSYDAEGNVISVDGGVTAQYTYDALNRRVQVQTGSGTNAFTYDYAGRRISSWNASNDFGDEGRIYWDGQQIAYRALDGTTYFDHSDWRGTERLRTGYSGADAAVFSLYPFGDESQAVGGSGPNLDNAGYASLEYDYETNTGHAQYRQYSSAQGRWMSPDPYSGSYDFSNPQSLNRYSYVLNNPLSAADPSGLFILPPAPVAGCPICAGVIAGIDAIAGLGDLLGWWGGPSFSGSLQPRPNIPGANASTVQIYSYPSNLTPINPGAPYTFQAYAVTSTTPEIAPQLPTVGEILAGAAQFAEAIPPVAASLLLLNMQGDNSMSQACKSEWAQARDYCSTLMTNPGRAPNIWGGSFDRCVRGQVSQACGGNRVN